MGELHESTLVVHEVAETDYNHSGNPTQTRRISVTHPSIAKDSCPICEKTEFSAISVGKE